MADTLLVRLKAFDRSPPPPDLGLKLPPAASKTPTTLKRMRPSDTSPELQVAVAGSQGLAHHDLPFAGLEGRPSMILSCGRMRTLPAGPRIDVGLAAVVALQDLEDQHLPRASGEPPWAGRPGSAASSPSSQVEEALDLALNAVAKDDVLPSPLAKAAVRPPPRPGRR
jgi:hypothetical protein